MFRASRPLVGALLRCGETGRGIHCHVTCSSPHLPPLPLSCRTFLHSLRVATCTSRGTRESESSRGSARELAASVKQRSFPLVWQPEALSLHHEVRSAPYCGSVSCPTSAVTKWIHRQDGSLNAKSLFRDEKSSRLRFRNEQARCGKQDRPHHVRSCGGAGSPCAPREELEGGGD